MNIKTLESFMKNESLIRQRNNTGLLVPTIVKTVKPLLTQRKQQ